ncbi:TPA: hypothetical protein DIV55_06345 [Patescibacteria group bacterium]|uniref:Uncharacterized protein n=1 Tax=Candidatus Gottesmanbacteria bacterium GW2011_GWA1_43_11 TaxID=1618436 RepID=A0A0G1FE11_9BACT|nr:MAG: hypothetical protein UV59_C0011G0034 [Candidatus Gottesmanbacteria bacterium GW2011_GWA1_43_11]HCS79327.1 hypothetical protein [Patescibacteria group bacterium]
MNLDIVTSSFLKELRLGKAGKPDSLRFIRHQISSSPTVQPNELFQVLTIGGTMCKNTLLRKTSDNFIIVQQTKLKQPGFNTAAIFLDFLNSQLHPNVKVLGLNFAFPLNPTTRDGRLDGLLVAGTKEHTFAGLVGKTVGETIEVFMKKKNNRKVKISCANDTICLLLSGLTQTHWQGLAAGIVGTGLNFAIFLDEHTLVNLEAANFNKFTVSETGKWIDLASKKPGAALFEKEISGAYLFQHFNLLTGLKINSTEELHKIAEGKSNYAGIAQRLFNRSAMLVSCQIAGITKFYKNNITFVMEGSLFWKGWKHRETVTKHVAQLIPEYQVNFVEIENSGILGAAKLVA